jgi:hypothetical protein
MSAASVAVDPTIAAQRGEATCEPRIELTAHLVERLAERFPHLRGSASAVARAEVSEAIREGRVCCRKPRALVPSGRRPRAERGCRFVWTEGYTRTYLVHSHRVAGERRRAVVVVTVLSLVERADFYGDGRRSA